MGAQYQLSHREKKRSVSSSSMQTSTLFILLITSAVLVTKSTSAPAVEGETEATEATESTESTDPAEARQEVLEIKQESKSNLEVGSRRADRRASTNLLARRSG